jgi:hypothetical protein
MEVVSAAIDTVSVVLSWPTGVLPGIRQHVRLRKVSFTFRQCPTSDYELPSDRGPGAVDVILSAPTDEKPRWMSSGVCSNPSRKIGSPGKIRTSDQFHDKHHAAGAVADGSAAPHHLANH